MRLQRDQVKYEVLVVDDHPLYRAALSGAVAAACPDVVLYEAASVAGLFDLLEQHPQADLLLLDLHLPGAYGFNALAHLRGAHPELPVIIVSASDDPRTMRLALTFGAQGFVSKSADAATIAHYVPAVLCGKSMTPAGMAPQESLAAEAAALDVAQRVAQLTPQQFRVFGMLCAGRLNKQIAYDLQITSFHTAMSFPSTSNSTMRPAESPCTSLPGYGTPFAPSGSCRT